MSAALDRKLNQAAAALAAGDLARAERLSREVLDRAPRHPRALRLAAAVRLQQEDGAGAGELLRQALASDPNDPQLLEGLGAAAHKAGHFSEAETWLRRALDLGHAGSAVFTWLGLTLSAQDRHPEAVEMLRQAAQAAPDDAGAHLNLGHELARLSAWDDAIASYERALRLKPQYAEALNGLGSVLLARGEHEAAAARFRQALAVLPDFADAHDNLGDALLRAGMPEDAAACFRRAIALNPQHADYYSDLGNALQEQQLWDDAIATYQRALELRPDYPEALNSLGATLQEKLAPEQAIAPIQRALSLRPDYAEAHDNLGNALLQLGREEEANASFRRAIEAQPDKAERYLRFANALVGQYRWDEAIAQYECALALKPELADAHYGIGGVHLFRQEFDVAWAGYERRHEVEHYRKRYFRDQGSMRLYERLPHWQGPAEAGVRDVAIWAEQAIGDQTLFSTLIPELLGAGKSFIYEVDRRLLGAYQRACPDARFVAKEEPPRAELQLASRVLAIGSLPALFRRSRESFSRQPARLLEALPDRISSYRQQLDRQGPGPKVALSWKSARRDWWVAKKTSSLAAFAPLLKLPGVQFLDVQYGDTNAERSAVEQATGVKFTRFDGVDYFNDLEEVLAILEACDLLITTSNATAHFAGALGKRTWLLYLADRPPFHYWAHAGDYRCLWYPSVEFITAPQYTEWPALIDHVKDRLAASLDAISARR